MMMLCNYRVLRKSNGKCIVLREMGKCEEYFWKIREISAGFGKYDIGFCPILTGAVWIVVECVQDNRDRWSGEFSRKFFSKEAFRENHRLSERGNRSTRKSSSDQVREG